MWRVNGAFLTAEISKLRETPLPVSQPEVDVFNSPCDGTACTPRTTHQRLTSYFVHLGIVGGTSNSTPRLCSTSHAPAALSFPPRLFSRCTLVCYGVLDWPPAQKRRKDRRGDFLTKGDQAATHQHRRTIGYRLR